MCAYMERTNTRISAQRLLRRFLDTRLRGRRREPALLLSVVGIGKLSAVATQARVRLLVEAVRHDLSVTAVGVVIPFQSSLSEREREREYRGGREPQHISTCTRARDTHHRS